MGIDRIRNRIDSRIVESGEDLVLGDLETTRDDVRLQVVIRLQPLREHRADDIYDIVITTILMGSMQGNVIHIDKDDGLHLVVGMSALTSKER